jgi:hypothetical protein
VIHNSFILIINVFSYSIEGYSKSWSTVCPAFGKGIGSERGNGFFPWSTL